MFTEQEILLAIAKATTELNKRSRFMETYLRGFNDCFAFVALYDGYLRGETSEAFKVVDFQWESTKEFMVKLYKAGYTPAKLTEECGYEIILSKRPLLGDIAFEEGSAMINDGKFWISPCEDNSGVRNKKQSRYFERHLTFLARPRR